MAMYRDGCIWQGEKVRLRAFELGDGGIGREHRRRDCGTAEDCWGVRNGRRA